MKYFKDGQDVVYAYEADGSQDAYIKPGLAPITEAEADTLRFPVVTPAPRQFASLEVLELFTEQEQLAVATAAMTIPQVKLWYDKLLAAQYVTIADARTEAGLSALVAGGLLTEQRRTQIVAEMSNV